jgi:hypothetical protein
MLLPDNVHPELSVYYNGAIVIEQLKSNPNQHLLDLYQCVKAKNGMSFATYVLSLDWLFLIHIALVDDKGVVHLCS